MTLTLDDPTLDRVRVDRLTSGHWPRMRPESRTERDTVILRMRRNGAHLPAIAAQIGTTSRRVGDILRCLADPRIAAVDPPGLCDRCPPARRLPAEWAMGGRVYCLRHVRATASEADLADGHTGRSR
ncbi:MAG TPA: hypothetical protein VIS06_15320 [Mycobacteriales bacterium]